MEGEFSTRAFDLVHNLSYSFYKLYINDVCQFDEFYEKVCSIQNEKKQMHKIIALMDSVSKELMLPATKFKQIKNVGRKDIFEFKEKKLRVYVIFQVPNVYVVMGGYKNNQDKDISKLKNRVKNFSTKD